MQLSNKHFYKKLTIIAERVRGDLAIRESEIRVDPFLEVAEWITLEASVLPEGQLEYEVCWNETWYRYYLTGACEDKETEARTIEKNQYHPIRAFEY